MHTTTIPLTTEREESQVCVYIYGHFDRIFEVLFARSLAQQTLQPAAGDRLQSAGLL